MLLPCHGAVNACRKGDNLTALMVAASLGATDVMKELPKELLKVDGIDIEQELANARDSLESLCQGVALASRRTSTGWQCLDSLLGRGSPKAHP